MDLYLTVRLAYSEGMTQREAAKHFNISRDTVRKMVAYPVPPGYRRRSPVRWPKLDAFVATIDHWLDEDMKVLRKQRHTAKRVFDRLRDECGFTGGYPTHYQSPLEALQVGRFARHSQPFHHSAQDSQLGCVSFLRLGQL